MAITDALRLAWMPDIHRCGGARSYTTHRLLRPQVVTPSSGPWLGGFRLYVANPRDAMQYFGHEADRFATAAFESMLINERSANYPRSVGWLLIRSYYAAFFSVHALLRVHGWACTRLSPADTLMLERQFKSLYNAAPPLHAGLYMMKSGSAGVDLDLQHMQLKNGGSHEALWGLLPGFISELGSCSVTGAQTDHQDLIGVLSDFETLVNKFGGPAWFTRMRNEVNYSHARGTWFPYEKATTDFYRLANHIDGWLTVDRPALAAIEGDELEVFASACAFLLTLCKLTFKDLARRSKPNSTFRRSSGLLLGGLH